MTEFALQQHQEATGHFGICSRKDALAAMAPMPLSTGRRHRQNIGKVGKLEGSGLFLFIFLDVEN